ncbi:MAG: hypothetical protein D3909_02940, partial [Candidatus Electrothrix sp. ATG1]|nr:hypothetical protein [Candidatus Electrothrix sp. ATG1]
MLRDIGSRPEDYAGHLGNLSAGLGSVVHQDEHEQSIVDALLNQTGIRTGTAGEHTSEPGKGQGKNVSSVLLWQARLLLKLGESVDRTQAEMRQELNRMTGQQEALLQELRKEENNEVPFFDLSTIPLDNEIPFAQQRLRLKAWTRLFTLSEESLEGAAFISPSPDAVEALLEHYRQKYAETKQQLLLPLPVF